MSLRTLPPSITGPLHATRSAAPRMASARYRSLTTSVRPISVRATASWTCGSVEASSRQSRKTQLKLEVPVIDSLAHVNDEDLPAPPVNLPYNVVR